MFKISHTNRNFPSTIYEFSKNFKCSKIDKEVWKSDNFIIHL